MVRSQQYVLFFLLSCIKPEISRKFNQSGLFSKETLVQGSLTLSGAGGVGGGGMGGGGRCQNIKFVV